MIWDDEKYTTKMPYKDINSFKQFYVYKKGAVVLDAVDMSQIISLAKSHGLNVKSYDAVSSVEKLGYIVESVTDDKAYSAYKKELQMDAARLYTTYMDDLFLCHGSSIITKEIFDIAYFKAYSRGHSSGHNEVESILENEIDFIVDIINAYSKAK